MAKRKTSSKNSAQKQAGGTQQPSENVIIDAVAVDVDPSTFKAKAKAKAKTAPDKPTTKTNSAKAGSTLKDTATTKRPGELIISLVALLLGGSGLALGGMAYLSIIKSTDNSVQLEAITKLVDERVDITLTRSLKAINADIVRLSANIDALQTAPNQHVDSTKITTLEASLRSLKSRIDTLSPNGHSHEMAVQSSAYTHEHDSMVTQSILMDEITQLRAAIDAVTPNAPKSEDNMAHQIDNDAGWWGNLMSAFSITRISPEEAE